MTPEQTKAEKDKAAEEQKAKAAAEEQKAKEANANAEKDDDDGDAEEDPPRDPSMAIPDIAMKHYIGGAEGQGEFSNPQL